jgi:hypothetical protein
MKKPPIAKRIAELKGEAAEKCSMTREKFVESLVAMYRSSPGEASLDNALCDSLISRGVRHAVFPMKTAIAAQLSKLTGWDAPTKLEGRRESVELPGPTVYDGRSPRDTRQQQPWQRRA